MYHGCKKLKKAEPRTPCSSTTCPPLFTEAEKARGHGSAMPKLNIQNCMIQGAAAYSAVAAYMARRTTFWMQNAKEKTRSDLETPRSWQKNAKNSESTKSKRQLNL
jgi:hypothetical protein